MRVVVLSFVLLLAGCTDSTKKLSVGSACTPQADGKSAECADSLCLALDDQSGFCTKDCKADRKCPDGYACEAAGRFGLVCQKQRGCKADADCPSGHRCDADSETCFIKVSRSICSPCESDKQCPSGGVCFTAAGSGERFCTSPCDAFGVCPNGYACSALPGTDKTNQCVPLTQSCNFGKTLCAPCRGDNECGTHLDACVRNVVSGEQFCGQQCSPNRPEDCPAAFGCVDLSGNGSGPFQCVPDSRTCEGYCDSVDERIVAQQCGLGFTCDTANRRCTKALDGRECSPCQTNDDCAKPGHEQNECVVNTSTNSTHKGETMCAEPCPTVGGNAECLRRLGPGFSCQTVGNRQFCVPDKGTCVGGLGRLGEDCTTSGPQDCVTGVCLEAGIASVCSARCALDAECGDSRYRCCEIRTTPRADGTGDDLTYDCGTRNTADTGPSTGRGVCSPQGGNFGDDCSPGRPPCTSGACLDLGTAQICTTPCDPAACPPEFECRQAADGVSGEAVSVCFPIGGGGVGSDCTFGPAACSGRFCIKKESGNVCTQRCGSAGDCPAGYTCEETTTVDGRKDKLCLPPAVQ